MKLTDEAREKIADIVYELNVDPGDVDEVVDKIAAAIPDAGITIDMAGVMDKVTPEMLDTTRDIMIDGLLKSCERMRKALEPFANCVFNDNGDMTVSDTHRLSIEDYARAYFAHKGAVPTQKPSGPPPHETPAEMLERLSKGATRGKWGQFSATAGPWVREARALWGEDRKKAIRCHDSTHHISAMDKDGNPYRVAEFTHAADAAFVETLVNHYREMNGAT